MSSVLHLLTNFTFISYKTLISTKATLSMAGSHNEVSIFLHYEPSCSLASPFSLLVLYTLQRWCRAL